MTRVRILIIIVLLTSLLGMASDRVSGFGDSFLAARLMPKGALLYVQSRDLAGQLNRWYASETHKRYFASSNYNAFISSRLALKFQDRVQEFQTITGLSLDEAGLAGAVGGSSALALYDIGNLDFVFVTELNKTQAVQSALITIGKGLPPRKYAGVDYYIKSATSELGEDRTFVFAVVGSRAIVATKEDLLKRALKNLSQKQSDDQLWEPITATLKSAPDFTSHDLTLWLDQEAINKDRYFNNYWIHNNVKSLTTISKGLVDLEITPQGLKEQRWLLDSSSQETDNGSLTKMANLIPTTSTLAKIYQVNGHSEQLYPIVSEVLFGPQPPKMTLPSNTNNLAETRSSGASNQRYGFLDKRFDQEIDSPELIPVANTSTVTESDFSTVLASAVPASYSLIGEPVVDTSGFVRFNRALVIELSQPTQFSSAKFEQLVTNTLTQRFVVTGNPVKFDWQTGNGGTRSLAKVLIEQGGAYAIKDNYLFIANSETYLQQLLNTNNTIKLETAKLTRFAQVQLKGGKDPYDKLMRRLDGLGLTDVPVAPKPVNKEMGEEGDGEGEGEGMGEETQTRSLLFSQNISSLIDVAKDVNSVSLAQYNGNGVIKQQVFYKFATATPVATPTPSATPATSKPTPKPTNTPTAKPVAKPSPKPSATPKAK